VRWRKPQLSGEDRGAKRRHVVLTRRNAKKSSSRNERRAIRTWASAPRTSGSACCDHTSPVLPDNMQRPIEPPACLVWIPSNSRSVADRLNFPSGAIVLLIGRRVSVRKGLTFWDHKLTDQGSADALAYPNAELYKLKQPLSPN
jgi:hypothetical protein